MIPLRVGVLGCANIARRSMLPAMRADPDVEVSFVSSRDPEKAAAFAAEFGARAVTGYERLLETDADAVYIPLPTGLHAEWAIRCLRAGKHVLAEKPLAVDSAEARAVVETARATGRLVTESFVFLHHPQHAVVTDLVRQGRIGEIRSFTAEFGIPPLPATDIRYDPALGGGALLDLGSYCIRAAQLFLGDDLSVAGAVLARGATGVDVRGSVLLRTPDDIPARLEFGLEHQYRCAYSIWGSEGRITVERAFTTPPTLAPIVEIETPGSREMLDLPPAAQFPAAVAAFAAQVRENHDQTDEYAAIERQAGLIESVRAVARRAQPLLPTA
jgi:dTDP-3,4-didehydro-2,6-dideoxy-alpha-D-glucose 3-reductase